MSQKVGETETEQEQSVTAMIPGTMDANDEPQDQDGHEMGTALQDEHEHQNNREVS